MEEDINILTYYVDKVSPFESCAFCYNRPKIDRAIQNLISRYRELEKINIKYEVVKKLNEIQENKLELYYIPKSKVKEKIEELEERNISYFDIVRYLKDLLEES